MAIMVRNGAGLCLGVLLVAPSVWAQGLAIDHRPVGCIVVGKYPRMNACFAPAGQFKAGRIYFRPEGAPAWYYVNMASDAPCHTGILPRPTRKLLDKKIEYYIQGTSASFAEGQSESYLPTVVGSEGECKDGLIAPYLTRASVAVFPAMPAGFAGGGLGAGMVAAGVVGAGAAATGAVVAAGKDDGSPTTTAPGRTVSNPTPQPQTPPTPPPDTTPPPQSTNAPPNAVFKVNPDPPAGDSPLSVNFNMCQSTDPDNDRLSFRFRFGDGSEEKDFCRMEHTYKASTFVGVRAADEETFDARICVTDNQPGHEQCKTYAVRVKTPEPPEPPDPCGGDRTGPQSVALTSPKEGADVTTDVQFTATASDSSGIQSVTYKVRDASATAGAFTVVGSSSSSSNGYLFTWPAATIFSTFGGCTDLEAKAEATDTCLNSAESGIVTFFVNLNCFRAAQAVSGLRLTWSNQIDVPSARGQVIVNGRAASFPGVGRSMAIVEGQEGTNRIEALLVQAAGAPGTWRFEFAGESAVEPGSLSVIAGQPVEVTGDSVTFRLAGRRGERIVFTFRLRR
jgi:hypothetical protein